MKILIIGGAGYIGYDLVNSLERQSNIAEITVFDNLYKYNVNFFAIGEKLKKTTFVKGDLLNKYDLEKVVKDKDVIIHLAGHVEHPYSYKDNFKYEQVNQYGAVVLYDLLKDFPPKKLIYLSSAAVYGFKNVISESEPTEPENYYGKSKLEAEKYLLLLKDKTEVYILRAGNVFGYNPQIRLDNVINNFMFDALIYKKIKIFGNGNQHRPFIYMPELTEKIQSFISLKNSNIPDIYNLSQGHLSLNEIRDFLMENIAELEFAYIDATKELPSITMNSNKISFENDLQASLKEAFVGFEKQFRFK